MRLPASLRLFVVIALGSCGALAACGDDDDSPTVPAVGSATGTASVSVEGDLLVFAASSLTDAFNEMGVKFSEKYPKTKVKFSFAASSALSTQINEGARADVFASADNTQMKVVTDKGNAAGTVTFATNQPVVVVPKSGSPVQSFNDLSKSGVRFVLAAPDVPIGRYAREILTNASKPSGGIAADFSDKALANLKSNESNVRGVLAKVQLGEADAGIVYSTDAAVAANDVKVIEVPAAYNVVATYPMAVLKGSKNAAAARAFVDFVTGAEGKAILAKYGFGAPR